MVKLDDISRIGYLSRSVCLSVLTRDRTRAPIPASGILEIAIKLKLADSEWLERNHCDQSAQ